MKEFSKLSMELIEPSNDSLLIWAEHSSEFFCLSVRLSFHLPVCLSVKFWHFHLVFQKHWANFSLTQSTLGRRGFKRLQIKIEAFSQAEIMAYFNTRPFILLINVSQISNGALRSLFSFVKQLKKKSFEFCVCGCLFVWSFFRPSREFFTHLETTPSTVKGCKFWPMLGTLGQWAVRVRWRAKPTVTRGIRL